MIKQLKQIILILLICFSYPFISTVYAIDLTESQNTQQLPSSSESNSIESSNNSYTNPNDPLESYNRNAFGFNDTLDRNVLRPVAVGYLNYIPLPIRYVLHNVFNNLRDFISLGNDILQLHGEDSMHNLMRVSINSTFGILGIIDISSSLGLKQKTNSFGQTFQTYGWKHSSYFIIPILGPSTVRDSLGLIPDTLFNPTWWIFSDPYVSVGLFVVNGIDRRTRYLDYDQLMYNSIDPYITMRDSYLQSTEESSPSNGDSGTNIDTLLNDESQPQDTGHYDFTPLMK